MGISNKVCLQWFLLLEVGIVFLLEDSKLSMGKVGQFHTTEEKDLAHRTWYYPYYRNIWLIFS
jgi:hypothetical protein